MTRDAEDFWSFAVRVYGAPGVRDDCLALQDRHGVDVNILLYAAFLAVKGQGVSERNCEELIAATEDWRVGIVHPLRRLRREMKRRSTDDARLEFLYSSLKRAELDAERAQHLLLIETLPPRDRPGDSVAAPDPTAVLANCLKAFGFRDPIPPESLIAALG